MIEISQLTKKFDSFTAVDDLSFKVAEGEVLGFLGPNGAGKSTTMKVITGFLAPTQGSVTVDGHNIATDPIAVKSLIGYLPEGAPSYPDMTTLEFLDFIAEVRGFTGEEKQRRIQKVIDDVELGSVCHKTIDTLSKGFKRRVGLAQAIIHDPKVLILDEPTDGLDPNQKHHVRQLIRNLAKDKIVIISTHILEEVSAVCSRAIIIARGRILADGTPKELEARSAYYGAVSIRLTEDFDLRAALAADPDVREIEQADDSGRHFILLPVAGRHLFNKVSEKSQNGHWPVAEFHMVEGLLEDYFRHVTQDSALESAHMISTEQQGETMNKMQIIFARELAGYFATPLAYVFIVIFLVMSGIFTFDMGAFYERGQADLMPFFNFHPWLYLFMIPAIAMSLWADERKTGTIELLMTLPVKLSDAVLGKFLAAWVLCGVALLLTFPIWITVNYLGDPDNGVIVAAYLGSWLMAGGFLSIGSCMSAMTRNSVIAFILTVAICFVFVACGTEIVLNAFAWAPQFLVDAIAALSFLTHFDSISKGVLDIRDILFFIVFIASWLFASAIVIEIKKAN